MENISTADFYEACYYLLSGCSITTISCKKINGKLTCSFSFEGEHLPARQIDYFQGRAEVNLLQFRRAYAQVNSYAYQAKRKWEKEEQQ
jgi:hypothetical protein